MSSSATCTEVTEWGQCQQDPLVEELCGFHWHKAEGRQRNDRYYEEKVVLGLVTPTDHYLDQVEIQAMFAGRPRHDGRRIDEYTV